MATHHDILHKLLSEHGNNQKQLAKALGISQQGVSYLLKAESISPQMAVRIERATGGEVNRAILRPDIFGAAA